MAGPSTASTCSIMASLMEVSRDSTGTKLDAVVVEEGATEDSGTPEGPRGDAESMMIADTIHNAATDPYTRESMPPDRTCSRANNCLPPFLSFLSTKGGCLSTLSTPPGYATDCSYTARHDQNARELSEGKKKEGERGLRGEVIN